MNIDPLEKVNMNNSTNAVQQNTPSDRLKVRRFGRWNKVGLQMLIQKEALRFLSVYMQTIIAPVVTTLLFYVVFTLALGGEDRMMNDIPYMQFIAPGLIMMTMAQNAFANTSSSIIIAKAQGNIVDILMPPLSHVELFLGYTIGAIVRGFIIGVVCLIAFAIFNGYIPQDPLKLFIFGILGTSMLGIIGVIGGIWADKFDHIAAVTNFIITPLTFLSGTFYSLDKLSGGWKILAMSNPFFHMIDGFRSGMTGESEANTMLSITILVCTNIVLIFVALRILKTGYKLKS